MASKFVVLGCLMCGEYIKGTLIDSMEQFEMHMCCISSPNDKKPSKKQNLLKLRGMIDEEIAKITQTVPGTLHLPSKPPPLPPTLPPMPPTLITTPPTLPVMPQG